MPSVRLWLGSFFGIGPDIQAVNATLPGYSQECGSFHHGSGSTWRAGLLAEYAPNLPFHLQLRAGIAAHNGELRERLANDRPIRLPDNSLSLALIDQVVASRALDLEIALIARAALAGRLMLQGGLGLAHTLSGSETHSQEAVQPASLLFVNNQRELTLETGTLFHRSPLVVNAEAGLGYDLPISASSTLSPEATLTLPITSRTGDGAWRQIAARVGVGVRFGLKRDTVVPPPPPPPDTAVLPRRNPELITSVVTEPDVIRVHIDEYDSVEVLPILNQIFFAENTGELKEPYRQLSESETIRFTNEQLVGSALDVYYQTLNIIGRRLRENPGITLTVNGYRNGHENDPAIALKRAETIKRYLTSVWKIPERRIRTHGGGLPPNPARENTREGLEENSRAELIPSEQILLSPILRRYKQRVATPPAITFRLHALAEAGIRSWRLETQEIGKGSWRTFTDDGPPPDSIVWDWRAADGRLPDLPMQLRYSFTVLDSSGHATTTNVADIDVEYISVEQKLEHRIKDTTIESYSILLFNFDSPKVSASDQDLLRLIGGNIKAHANLRLTGYTDSLGGAEHNHELATARARDVKRIMEKLVPADANMQVDEAAGGERERFPYNTPEGRSHCRTVVIDVRTPVKPGGS
ncbi:MAG: OmpA family protein [Bacteroidetes bacterium]|nr:OmpA family protein [Bacteroidota bacterium]